MFFNINHILHINTKQRFEFVHLSAGELLREEKNKNAEFAKIFNEYVQNGKIVPVKYTCNLLKKVKY